MIRAALRGDDPFAALEARLADLPADQARYVEMLDASWQPSQAALPNGTVWTCLAQAVWAVRTHCEHIQRRGHGGHRSWRRHRHGGRGHGWTRGSDARRPEHTEPVDDVHPRQRHDTRRSTHVSRRGSAGVDARACSATRRRQRRRSGSRRVRPRSRPASLPPISAPRATCRVTGPSSRSAASASASPTMRCDARCSSSTRTTITIPRWLR